MPKKTIPMARPYVAVKHEHADSLAAYELAATMLYNSVTAALHLIDLVKDERARKMLENMRVHAENFHNAAYGNGK